jgi:hypothetical protein
MERLRPDIYQKKISDIHFNLLKKSGIKLLLIDLDNTLLKYKNKEIEEDLKNLINTLKENFKIIIFSNGRTTKVKKVADTLEVEYISKAMKPLLINFKKVLTKYKVSPSEVAIIGDQMLTDVKGGNRIGITTILVEPLEEKESVFTKINRAREKKFILKMSAKGLFFKERYYE